jgi:AraC-like DNA-binding protein
VPARLLDRCLLRLHAEVADHAAPDPRILRAILQTWLWEVERAVGGAAVAPPGLLRARAAIASRFRETLTLTDLAAVAGCSRQHLCAGFRRWFGVAPIDLLIRTRLQQADLLLQDPAISAGAAAAEVGFGDYRHFARLYRRRFGHPARRR